MVLTATGRWSVWGCIPTPERGNDQKRLIRWFPRSGVGTPTWPLQRPVFGAGAPRKAFPRWSVGTIKRRRLEASQPTSDFDRVVEETRKLAKRAKTKPRSKKT